jgi:hypothetical protein
MGLEYITEPQIFLSSLSALGDHVQIDALVHVTSAVDIVNTGNGPALTVNQISNQPVAEFKDDGHTVLFIDGRISSPRRVGINTVNPNHALTVNGNISATGQVFSNSNLNGKSLFLNNPTGDTFLEMGGFNDVYIDLKVPNTDDYDLRIGTNATDSYIKTWAGQPLSFDTGNIFFNGGNFSIGAPSPNERLTVSGNISSSQNIYGFFVPQTSLVITNSNTLNLPLYTNDVELSAPGYIVITNFTGGVYPVTYILTNIGTSVISISSSPTVIVRDGLGYDWESHSCSSISNSVHLLRGSSCSVRIGSTGFASVW